MISDQKIDKTRNTDRVLTLRPKGEGRTLSSTGLVDPRLFTGENKLHITKDVARNIWSFKYEQGGLPERLKQRFTDFNSAFSYATNYFKTRNIEIVDVID